MKINKNSVYYLSVAMIALGHTMEVSTLFQGAYATFKTPWMLILFALMLYEILTLSARLTQFAAFFAFALLGVYTSVSQGQNWVIYITYLLFFVKGKDTDQVVRIIFRCTGVVFLINATAFLACYALRPGVLSVKDGYRYDLFCGGHPNQASRQFLFLCLMYIYHHFHKLACRRWISIALLSLSVYFFTRSDSLILLFVPFIAWMFRKRSSGVKIMGFIVKYGVLLILPLGFAYFLLGKIPALAGVYQFADSLSSGRLTLGAQALKLYGITWFGADTKFGIINYKLVYADNAYIYMLVHLGAVYILPLIWIFGMAAKKLDYRGMICAAVYIVYGLNETGITDAIFSYFPLILSMHAIFAQEKAEIGPLARSVTVT